MKKWETPVIMVQEFEANEYVAACGDENRVYKFVCDAPAGTLYYYPTGDGDVDGEYKGTGEAVRLGWYDPCDASHEAPTTGDFYDGYIVNHSFWEGTTTRNVIVWRGPNNNNGHATAHLDMDAWETDKS